MIRLNNIDALRYLLVCAAQNYEFHRMSVEQFAEENELNEEQAKQCIKLGMDLWTEDCERRGDI